MAITADNLLLLLEKMGINAVVRTYPNAVFDPTKNKTDLGALVEYVVKVIPPYQNQEGYKKTVLITSGSGMTGFANMNLQFDVKAGLVMVINSKEWTVTGVVPISNKNGIVFYLLEIESGH